GYRKKTWQDELASPSGLFWLRFLAGWSFLETLIAEASINILLEVDNPVKVLVNTSVVYLRWNYTIAGDEEFKEVDFHFGADNVYIGYIDTRGLKVSSKFKDRFNLERPGTLIIYNVTASDTGIYTIAVKTREATKVESSVYLDVLVEPEVSTQECPSPVTEGSNVTLHCNASGNPPPSITWIWQDTGDVLTHRELLTLTAVNRSQAGSYQCLAS
ncbi:limbic system-associated membrane protein-like, partial [Orbicella faveolata]|uniref:limbic system-associated membrane protein-like n=1 Tax=Orbicella faveolata TaxID=48498 RepID=UPI0009E65498